MRTALLEDQPFYGLLSLRLKLVEDPTCDTMWTDGVSLGFSPSFVFDIAEVELKGTICHEVLHVVGQHPWRQEHREHERWNEACDYAINPIVRRSKYVLPKGALFDERFVGMSAEAIYRELPECVKQAQKPKGGSKEEGDSSDKTKAGEGSGENDDNEGQPGSANGAKQGGPSKSSKYAGEVRKAPAETQDSESEHSAQGWTLAIQTAINAQGELPLGLHRYIQASQRNKIAWEEVLRDFFERSSNNPDYTWRMPSMRFAAQGMYMPRLEGVQLPPFVFAVDSSGSMPDSDLARAHSAMQALLDELSPEVLYVLYCDAAVVAVRAFYPGDTIDLKPKGGGGTDFRPVFKWVKEFASEAAGVVYVSDLMGTFPEASDVEVPTLWVATSNTSNLRSCGPVPFGTVVQMPVS